MKAFLVGLAMGIITAWAILTSMADTQAEREVWMASRETSLQAKIDNCSVGQSCRIGGARFLKTAGVQSGPQAR